MTVRTDSVLRKHGITTSDAVAFLAELLMTGHLDAHLAIFLEGKRRIMAGEDSKYVAEAALSIVEADVARSAQSKRRPCSA